MEKIFDRVHDLKTKVLEIERKQDEVQDETFRVVSEFGGILSKGLNMELVFYDGLDAFRDGVLYAFSGENSYCEIMIDFSDLTLNSVKCDDIKDEIKVLTFF